MHPLFVWLAINGLVALELAVLYVVNRRRRRRLPPREWWTFVGVVQGTTAIMSALLLVMYWLERT